MHRTLRTLRTLRTSLVGAVAALSLTAACNRDRGAAEADTATRTAPGTVDQPAAPSTNVLRVTDVALGRAMRGDTAVVEELAEFGVRDTIHAVVRHEGAAQGATIAARWTFQDGQVVDERSETVSPTGARAEYTHFMISKPSGWPKGDYKLHVLVNGNEVQTKDFEVK